MVAAELHRVRAARAIRVRTPEVRVRICLSLLHSLSLGLLGLLGDHLEQFPRIGMVDGKGNRVMRLDVNRLDVFPPLRDHFRHSFHHTSDVRSDLLGGEVCPAYFDSDRRAPASIEAGGVPRPLEDFRQFLSGFEVDRDRLLLFLVEGFP